LFDNHHYESDTAADKGF